MSLSCAASASGSSTFGAASGWALSAKHLEALLLVRKQLHPFERKYDNSGSIVFQITDLFVTNENFSEVNVEDFSSLCTDFATSNYETEYNKKRFSSYWETNNNPCTVYMFGKTRKGQSVCIRVFGFEPWFYIEKPETWSLKDKNSFLLELRSKFSNLTIAEEERFRLYGWVPDSKNVKNLKKFKFMRIQSPNQQTLRQVRAFFFKSRCSTALSDKEVEEEKQKVNLNKDSDEDENDYFGLDYLKCQALPTHNVSGTFNPLRCAKHAKKKDVYVRLDLSEDRVEAYQKFLAARDLRASGWAEASGLSFVPLSRRVSYCDLEFMCNFESVFPRKDIDEICPLLIASKDGEMDSPDGTFPDSSRPENPVSFVGINFAKYGESGIGSPAARVMFVLGDCTPVEGTTVLCFTHELTMMRALRDALIILDPDIVTGYNIFGFDCKYFADRAGTRRGGSGRFDFMGRIASLHEPLAKQKLKSAAYGENNLYYFNMKGRVVFDMYMYIKINRKLSSYKLDNVAKKFIPDSMGKVVLGLPGWAVRARNEFLAKVPPEWEPLLSKYISDLSVADESSIPTSLKRFKREINNMREIGTLPELTPGGTERMAKALRHLEIAIGDDNYKKLFAMYRMGPEERSNIAKYCSVDCDLPLDLIHKLSVIPTLIKMSQVTHLPLAPTVRRGQQIKVFTLLYRFCTERNYVMNYRDIGWDPEAEYEGATVLEPAPGFYDKPVATLDFASLYPSIIRSKNLCFSTLVLDSQYQQLPGVEYTRYDLGGKTWLFVTEETHAGILPEIEGWLLSARKAKKREMYAEKNNPFKYDLLDAEQLALKVVCNSAYGFCGVRKNPMFNCIIIAVAVTCTGRNMIELTKDFVNRTYPGVEVIYGDTDSVMVHFKTLLSEVPKEELMRRTFQISEEMAAGATAMFPSTVLLEFEKVFFPYALYKKKMYAGMKYEGDPNKPPKLDAKGLEMVRRDKAALLRSVQKDILTTMMRDRDSSVARQILKNMLARFVENKIVVEDVVLSKSLKGTYKNENHAHVQVIKKMKSRQAFDVPAVGDRVPFVTLKANKGEERLLVCQRAEHPDYAEQHRLQLDRLYYLELFKKPILQMVEPLPIDNVKNMFQKAKSDIERQLMNNKSICDFLEVKQETTGKRKANSEQNQKTKKNEKTSKKRRAVQQTLLGSPAKEVQRKIKRKKVPQKTHSLNLFLEK
jgi:DNA polymerase elongation subunit (family B)